MALRYKRLLKETETSYSISKTDKKKNKLDSCEDDSLPCSELIAKIDTDLKHLQGQKKILQNAKEGKTWRYKFSINEKINSQRASSMNKCISRNSVSNFYDVLQKIVENKTVKVTDSSTQIGSSLNNLNMKRNCRGSISRDLHKFLNTNSHFDQNVHLPSGDKSSLHVQMKTKINKSSVRKESSKTQTKKNSKRLLSQKHKNFSSEKPSSEYNRFSPKLESKASETFNILTKLEEKSKVSETPYNSHISQSTNNNLRKEVRSKSIYTQTKRQINDKHTKKNMTLSSRSSKSLERTESSIRRHAKLSEEIFDYAKRRGDHRPSQKTNKEKKPTKEQFAKEISSKVDRRSIQSPNELLFTRNFELLETNQNLALSKESTKVQQNGSIPNYDTFSMLSSEGRKSWDKKEDRKHVDENERFKNHNLAEPSCSSKLHYVNKIKSNVIDDSTYLCPDNSKENDYLLIPYVGNISEPERENLDNRGPLLEDAVTSRSFVILENTSVSSQPPSSIPFRSIRNERKVRTYDSHYEPETKKGFTQHAVDKNVSQRSEYLSHNLESTWESHANRDGPLSSKFDTSHNNRIGIDTDYRSCYNDLKVDHPNKSFLKQSSQKTNEMTHSSSSFNNNSVNTKVISKALQSDKHILKDKFYGHKSQMKQEKCKGMPMSEFSNSSTPKPIIHISENRSLRKSFSSNDSVNNQAFAIEPLKLDLKSNALHSNLKSITNDSESKNSASTQPWEKEKNRKSLPLESYQNSAGVADTSNEILINQNDFENYNLEIPPLKLLTKKAPELGAISRTILLNSGDESPTLIIPHTMKTPVKYDQFRQDTKQDKIFEKDNIEISTSTKETNSIESETPRQNSRYSDIEIQEEVFKQGKHNPMQNHNLISKSFVFETGGVSKKNTSQNQLRLRESKSHLQHKFSLPVNRNFNQKPSEVSDLNETEHTTKCFQLGAILRTSENRRELDHLPLSAKIEECETQNISHEQQRNELKTNSSTANMSWKIVPESTSQKNIPQDNQLETRKSESTNTLNDYELGAITNKSSIAKELVFKSVRKIDTFALVDQLKEYTTQNVPRKRLDTVKKINAEQILNEITANANKTVYLNSGSNHDSDVEVSTTFRSISKMNANEKNFDGKSKPDSFSCISSFSLPIQSKIDEIEDVSQHPQRSEPKICASPDGIFLQVEPDQPLKKDKKLAQQSDEKKVPKSQHIADMEVSKTSKSKLNGSELGAIPKVFSGTEKDLALKLKTNKSLLSIHVQPKQIETPGINNSNRSVSPKLEKPSQKKANNLADETTEAELITIIRSYSHEMNPLDRLLFSNDINDQESSITCSKIPSQQSLTNSNKSSAREYLKSFWHDNKGAKNIFRSSLSKLKKKLNSSSSSKSSQELSHESIKILQGTTRKEGSDVSFPRKFNSRSAHSLETDPEKSEVVKEEIFNQIKPRFDSNKPLTIPRPEEERPSVSFESNMSNNQTEMEENLSQNPSLRLDDSNSALNENKINVKHEKPVFLSDTFNQNIPVKGVAREVSDFIQHLENRVKDCDENFKNQSKEFEKLKNKCKIVEHFTSIGRNREEDEENKPKDLKESEAKVILGKNVIHEPTGPLIREDISEIDIKEESSCNCSFCGKEQSSSSYSEEIPSFNGCECMKEDYYNIMRIAYNK